MFKSIQRTQKHILVSISMLSVLLLPAFSSGQKDTTIQNESTDVGATTQPADIVSTASPDASSDEDIIEIWPSSLQPGEDKQVHIAYRREVPTGDPVSFNEVWAYVIEDRENQLTPNLPITDVCYFSAEVNVYGELSHIPDIHKLDSVNARKHLVITCDSRSLTHFILDPEFSVREKLVRQIVKAAKPYDGVQIDFEVVPARDAKHFRSFLLDVRGRLGKTKYFSVALPARTRTISDDIFDYKLIAPCVDRIVVMAYDEHWSTSKPGPVASMDWCEHVVEYATSVIPPQKLIMGLPFYGRTWEEECLSSAWRFEGMNDMLNANRMHSVSRDDGVIPGFTFVTQTKITGYFDDAYSLVTRCRLYDEKKVTRVAFWRIGQEDPTFWKWLQIKENK